jgi:hypothetical protein
VAGRKITIEFLGKDKSLQNTISGVEGKSSKLGGVLGKVGKAAAIGFAAVGVAAVAGGKYVLDHGAKLEQMAAKADTVFGSQIGAVEKWADKSAHAMGLTRGEATGLAANFGDLLIPMGFTRKEAAKMSTDVVGLSGALSQWSGGTVSTAEASDVLAKAMLGETDGLKALGISISAAEIEAQLLKQGQKDLTGEALAQAKAQATQTLIMEKSTDAQDAFAKGGSPLLSTQAKLSAVFKEVRDKVVMGLVPAFTAVGDWILTTGLPAMQKLGDWLQTNLLPKFQQLGDWIQTKVLPALRGIGDWISKHVLPIFQKLGTEGPSIFAKVRSAIESVIKTVISIAQKVGNNLRPVFEQLVDTFKSRLLPTLMLIIDRFQKWWPTISKVVGKVLDLASAILGKVLPPVIQFAGFLLSKLVPVILDVIEVLAKIIGKVYAVGAAFVGGVKDVAKFATGVAQKIGNVIQTVSEIPGKVLGALGSVGKTLYSAGSSIIQGLIDGIMAKVEYLKEKLQSVTKLIPDWKGPLDKDKILLKPAGEALIEGLISGIEKKKSKLQTVLEKITAHIKKQQDKLATLLDKRKSIVDSFRGFASSVFGADMGDADNPATAQTLVDHSAGQRGRAETLSADVKALIDKGLSKDMINELIASGQSGMDQIHLLASATDEQIAAVNANQAATQAALTAAGLAAADAVMGEQIAAAERDVKLADGIRDKLKELMEQQDKNTVIQLVLDGKVLHASLLKLKKSKNKKLQLD